MVNRTQAVVLGFFIVVWIALVGILMAAPTVYEQALSLLPGGRSAEFAFLAGISALIALLATGVLRRWRWTFWLIVVAFILGFLRVPASILQLARILPPAGPSWYVLLQGLVGLVQCAIGVAMLVGYRRAGPWGAF